MKSTYFRRAGTFCACCALTFAAFCGGSIPAIASEQHNIIANKIMQLQKEPNESLDDFDNHFIHSCFEFSKYDVDWPLMKEKFEFLVIIHNLL